MKFSEYLASSITPQMTLLEKFNALLKFLENENLKYKHSIDLTFLNPAENSYKAKIVIISDKKSIFSLEELKTFFENEKINGFIYNINNENLNNKIYFISNVLSGEYVRIIGIDYSLNIFTINLEEIIEISDIVEEYEV